MKRKAEEVRQQQAKLREQKREDDMVRKERERAVAEAERQEEAIESALEEALAKAKGEHSAEVEEWKRKLEEVRKEKERKKSQAELTKIGHVYVISNIGSFGDNLYKVGLTRREEPKDRVRELGDASVPFPFDINLMIWAEDSPALESSLHADLDQFRENKMNKHKEFFRVDLETIKKLVAQSTGEIEYEGDPEVFASEYYASLRKAEEQSGDSETGGDSEGEAAEDGAAA